MQIALPQDHQICAFLPDYTAAGDQTLLYTAERRRVCIEAKSKTVLHRLAARHAVDLRCLRANTARLTKSLLDQPLPLSADLLLVPCKIRRPKCSGDSTIGYFNFYQIQAVYSAASTTFILLKNGEKIAVLWREATVNLHLQRAHLTALAHRQSRPIERLLRGLAAAACFNDPPL